MMSQLITSDFFSGNRERLRQLFTGTAPIVVTAHGSLQKSSDEAFPFVQDRNFWYLTGIDEPNIVLVMDKGKEYLIVPDRQTVREQFDGVVGYEDVTRLSGIADVVNEKEGWRQLESRLRKVKHVATLSAPPKFIDFWGMYTNPARSALIHKLKLANPDIELLDLREHLARMRMVKQKIELDTMQLAMDITIDSLKEVMRPSKLRTYEFEYEIEADLSRGFRRRGAQEHSFTPVIASGKRACTIHHISNDGALASDELLLLDVGASYNHYAADIARTISIGGKPSRRQQLIYEAIFEAQDYAFSLLEPGIVPNEYEAQMELYVGEKLRELGLIKSIDRESVRKYFPHRTSHYLGLDAHDAGDYDRPLEPGAVLAVEPGIYIPEEGIGVRIEDDVVITEEGAKVMTDRLPRTLS